MKNLRRVALAAVSTVACLAALSGVASADSPNTLTIIGTSDVSDSGLFQNVIAPAFHDAYPQFNIQYFGTASGTAITDAETGAAVSGGASVLLVHAASLENTFVSGGYSYNNLPGYAVFRNDFVLAGPTSDPAGAAANAPNNAAQAFLDVANKGYDAEGGNPAVTFVSRGGTPGTTVEEHAIWQLIDQSGLRPSTLTLCTVSAANGGGETPVATNLGFANGAACSNLPAADQTSGLPTGAGLPDWYISTGANQGLNVIDANACVKGANGIKSATGTCYVFTDRGTYLWLASGTDPAGKIANLAITTRNNAATAPGGASELINYFHAYIINQATVNAQAPAAQVNLPAAQDLITLLTSPSFQASLQHYLAVGNTTPATNLTATGPLDPGGAPFIGDASPTITTTGLSGKVKYGSSKTVTGTVTQPEPGYPALSGQTVSVDQIVAGVPVSVAKGTTDASGNFKLKFSPKATDQYQVSTGTMSVLVNSTLSPTFSDTLSPGASASAKVTVTGAPAANQVRFNKITLNKIKKGSKAKTDAVKVTGKLSPAPGTKGAKVSVIALNLKTGKSKTIGHASIGIGKASFTVKGKLNRNTKYSLQLKYTQSKHTTLYSGLRTVSVK
jgi:tungstate transport system substrate-binding protein